jgi:hypothetical protein
MAWSSVTHPCHKTVLHSKYAAHVTVTFHTHCNTVFIDSAVEALANSITLILCLYIPMYHTLSAAHVCWQPLDHLGRLETGSLTSTGAPNCFVYKLLQIWNWVECSKNPKWSDWAHTAHAKQHDYSACYTARKCWCLHTIWFYCSVGFHSVC